VKLGSRALIRYAHFDTFRRGCRERKALNDGAEWLEGFDGEWQRGDATGCERSGQRGGGVAVDAETLQTAVCPVSAR
jgi:hypothetical protein